ncbi:MAG: nitroreductase [Paludibacteraceae bacterium]|nr:nitroreductase [Bacteroidales bacterium]MBR0065530.1 nitroreductase [Paludibacteraceae bacterium]
MTLQEAILVRHSVRQYMDKPVEAEKIAQLQALIDKSNGEAGLHMQLITNEPKAFSGGLAKYGKFSGVGNYIAMIAPKGKDVELGYYGEQVVLLAQTLGLNTCWVGLTFSKQPDKYEIREGEVLNSVIALGYGATQGKQHPQKKTIEDVCEDKRVESQKSKVESHYPSWFIKGVEAALLAPTAINQQKFLFELHDNNRVKAKARLVLLNNYASTDLGIVKCHFEIAAGKENFEWV